MEWDDWLLVVALALPPLVFFGARALSAARYGSQVDRTAPGDLLVFAAHPDDCAIMAGELAIEARRAGRRVRVLYLTSGSDEPDDARARMRREETEEVWQSLGVPADDLAFLPNPHTPHGRECSLSSEARAAGAARFREMCQALPPGATVVFNAAGELHPDHQAARAIAIEVLRGLDRSDLRVLEAPQYNAHLSLVRNCRPATLAILLSLPFVSRLVDKTRWRFPPTFVNGARGHIMPPSRERVARKCELLRGFESEDGELLVRLFGFRDVFRRADLSNPSESDAHDGYLRLAGRWLGASMLLMWGSLCLLMIVLASRGAFTVVRLLGSTPGIIAIAIFLGLVVVWWGLRRNRKPEQRLAAAAAGLGFDVGAVLAHEELLVLLSSLFL